MDPTLAAGHRSTNVAMVGSTVSLACRLGDNARLWDRLSKTNVETYALLVHAGVYGVSRIGFMKIDHALITAFVERWYQHTHTFHLPIGEATITLQDVAILFGLRVDGPPVTLNDFTRPLEYWQELCRQLLGQTPPGNAFVGNRLRASWIQDIFSALEDVVGDDIVYYARAYTWWLVGGFLIPDKSSVLLPLAYLQLLEDLDDFGRLSLGSAALACLYRNLCRASHGNAQQIGGPLILLQIWVWERFPRIAPQRLPADVEGKGPM